ncbi:hypothetical protein, partial [Klebsiella pneumoniae]|uniref:hypothetical protein n=1 Tax=Klebsiella pneumoniae TaxID=573 RepID=UPI001C6FBCB8
TTSRRFSKGYFGFDISGTIPFHRPTKWVQYKISTTEAASGIDVIKRSTGKLTLENGGLID